MTRVQALQCVEEGSTNFSSEVIKLFFCVSLDCRLDSVSVNLTQNVSMN